MTAVKVGKFREGSLMDGRLMAKAAAVTIACIAKE